MFGEDLSLGVISDDLNINKATQIQLLRTEHRHFGSEDDSEPNLVASVESQMLVALTIVKREEDRESTIRDNASYGDLLDKVKGYEA